MSAETKSTLEKIVLGIAILGFIFTVLKSAVLIPHDIDVLQAEVRSVQLSRATDHDLLQRIDERTAATQRDIQDLKARK